MAWIIAREAKEMTTVIKIVGVTAVKETVLWQEPLSHLLVEAGAESEMTAAAVRMGGAIALLSTSSAV